MQRLALSCQILALSALSAFSGALLFIALVVVEFWQSLEPQAYLTWMSDQFFRFPALMVPLNMLSLLLLLASLALSWSSYPSRRLPLGLGLFLLLACTLTFPFYFASANATFVNQTIDLTEVSEQLAIWSNWN